MTVERKSVVLLEDDGEVAKLVIEVLTSAGFRVAAFGQWDRALASMRRAMPDVLVLDWHLSQTTGAQVLDRLEAQGALPPVLVLTGDVRLPHPRRAAEVLRKPVNLNLLIERVEALAFRSPGAGSASGRETASPG
jgi:DNA-binding response OmpR family regulator